jgi:hypothetical protein
MAVAYVPDYSQAAFACMVGPDGDCTDYLRLPHLMKRKNSFREEEKLQKVLFTSEIRKKLWEKNCDTHHLSLSVTVSGRKLLPSTVYC